MQIEAFKDPVSGKIFESQQELDDFVHLRKQEAEKAARIAAIRARLLELRTLVANTLTAPAELAGLVQSTYKEVLELLDELATLRNVRRTKAELKSKVGVRSVKAHCFRFKPADYSVYRTQPEVYFEVNLEMTLSRDSYYRLFCDEMPDLDYRTVITGLETHSGGCSNDDETGEYHIDYFVRIPLSKLPLMRPRVAQLLALETAKLEYDRDLESAQWKARRNSAEVAQAEAEVEEAEIALRAAVAHRNALRDKAEELADSVAEAVAKDMPFTAQEQLEKAQVGFEDLPSNVDWYSLDIPV